MEYLKNTDAEVFNAISNETRRQAKKLEMIASENFVSMSVI